jgi:hypothetical protein
MMTLLAAVRVHRLRVSDGAVTAHEFEAVLS